MKRVVVVYKTHLDLGFTDFASAIKQKYIEEFIPHAISIANNLNKQRRQFVWTTGSWIIKEALADTNIQRKTNLINALQKGYIAAHAMPFTTHTELLDADTLVYGLSIINSIEKITNRKVVSAKMTDVPGHTRAIVPYLYRKGIKLLHIGVNASSAVPDVPECFLWKVGAAEVVVIYSKGYGREFKCKYIEDILYFSHSGDNCGAKSQKAVATEFGNLENKYVDYVVKAGTLDDYAELLWKKRAELPIITSEIGDSWIHGSATDPFKSGALRAIRNFKDEYKHELSAAELTACYEGILCIAEHTCGLDTKRHFGDYENYIKSDFIRARNADKVLMAHIFRGFPQNLYTFIKRKSGEYKQGSYKQIEKSWAEQRAYISDVEAALTPQHKAILKARLSALMPQEVPKCNAEKLEEGCEKKLGDFSININKSGGLNVKYKQIEILASDDSLIDYQVFGAEDYKYWLTHYNRGLLKNNSWVFGDFGRPLLSHYKKQFSAGRHSYFVSELACDEQSITCLLKIANELSEDYGAPRVCSVVFTAVQNNKLNIRVSFFNKDAMRLTEALYLKLKPCSMDIQCCKLGYPVSPKDIVNKGGKKVMAVDNISYTIGDNSVRIVNIDAPLFGMGQGNIMRYDNITESNGIFYNLYNNIWGTNFPLWYENNAKFDFTIEVNAKMQPK